MSTVNTSNTTTTGIGAGSSDTKAAMKGLNSNYQDFLKLLTTQLQNQDPTAPADTNQITQQIASLSQVEQQINTNNLLQKMMTMFNTSQVNSAVSYIGKQIDAAGNKIDLFNKQAAVVYELPAGASSVTVNITDSTGSVVFSGDGTKVAGRNQMIWNGQNSISGADMPNGAYTFSVQAKDSAGKDMDVTTYTTGIVTAVETKDGTNSLSIGSFSVPISDVRSIYTAGTNPSL